MMIQWPEATNEIVLHNESFYDKTFEESKELATKLSPAIKREKFYFAPLAAATPRVQKM